MGLPLVWLVGPALRSASDPPERPAGVPAADVLPRDTESASDLGLGAAGGEQLAGLETDTFEGLAVTQVAGVAAVGGWSHAARLPGQPWSCHRKGRTSWQTSFRMVRSAWLQ
jgi:hypothetical protein